MSNPIPEGWSLSKIGDFATEIKSKNSDLKPMPVLSVTKYKGFVLSLDYFKKQVFSRDTNTYKIVKKGQFAYATIHLDEGSLGLLDAVEEGQVSPMYTVFKTKGIDKTYLFNLLKSDDFMRLYPALGQGSINRRASIPFKVLADVDFACPPLPEQEKIAAILSTVDDVIEKTRAQIDKLKDLKTGMMQELLTKGIGHTEFKDSPVGRIPVGWDVKPCSQICSKITDGEHLSPNYCDSEFPILSAKDVREYGVDISGAKYVSKNDFEKMLKRCNPEYQDVLIVSRGATIGKTTLNISRVKFALMGSVILLKPNEKCFGGFLALYIALPSVQQNMLQLSGSSAQQAIYLKDIKDMLTPVPPMDEQLKIATAIDSIDRRIQASNKKYIELGLLKKALMQDLLTGKVRVNVDNKESAVA
ncbi:restriction endonuclease subunit S [Spongiibacter taiwanensis]|uniref:restriction endonuclease subunit S n=1 Tax=Spongiibacter taiwanensis TaxID=1748242 RepID=UPI0020353AE1|nr:restriction endonuclease subunit S [Spongiibacter taiwanensis]USA44728.1 restriction endonuclease subunit S [Spongiibacter taiwanensis]